MNLRSIEKIGNYRMELFTFFQSKESYNEDEILEMKEILNNQKVIVIKGVWDKNYIKSIKDHLASVGNSSIPNYHPILPDSKNFHRINKTDERSFVKGCFHQFNFFPWNQDYFDLFQRSKSIFNLKNILSDVDKNSYLCINNYKDENFTARIAFQFYPSGTGYLNKHSDPVAEHQFALPNMVMSKKGDDFISGGAYFELGKDRIYHEDFCDIGDVVFFDARLPHGVEIINNDINSNWLDFNGRWMGLFSVNKFATSQAITDSKELD
tara:strand:+ start:1914 stop:2711 length:798 start_codon:yes stop_codon:yes gene_type:complete